MIEPKAKSVLVNLHLPISLISTARKFGARIAINIEGTDLDEILERINSGKPGDFYRIERTKEIIEIVVE